MNRTRRRRTHKRQYQTQIVARASRKNEDIAAVLLYNNSLPQLYYSSGDHSIHSRHRSTAVKFTAQPTGLILHFDFVNVSSKIITKIMRQNKR